MLPIILQIPEPITLQTQNSPLMMVRKKIQCSCAVRVFLDASRVLYLWWLYAQRVCVCCVSR